MIVGVSAPTRNQLIGARGEQLVGRWYEQHGGQVIARNVRYPVGEIDLVVKAPDRSIVFVEVKTRTGEDFGGVESVGPRKWRRLRRAAARWLCEQEGLVSFRIDIVELKLLPGREPVMRLYRGASNGAC